MKKLLLSFATIVMIVAFSASLMAQTSSATENTAAGAVLITAMGISETAPMHFGSNLMTDASGGTIILPPNSTNRSYTGGLATSSATPVATNAAYSVTGTGLETYAITLPTTTTVTTDGGGANKTMDITSMLAFVASESAIAVTGTLDASGDDSFTLGGTLTVQANQVGGVYAGTFDVTVDYN